MFAGAYPHNIAHIADKYLAVTHLPLRAVESTAFSTLCSLKSRPVYSASGATRKPIIALTTQSSTRLIVYTKTHVPTTDTN
jgi:hypothetical protein